MVQIVRIQYIEINVTKIKRWLHGNKSKIAYV